MKFVFDFGKESLLFSEPKEILSAHNGVFKEVFSNTIINEPITWLVTRSKTQYLAGIIAYEAAWILLDVHGKAPQKDDGLFDLPDLIIGVFEEPKTHQRSSRKKYILKSLTNVSREEHREKVEKAIQAIYDGELFEVNITSQKEYRLDGNPFDFYHDLKLENEGDWFSYFHYGKLHLASASPECFLEVNSEGRVVTKPIKGTQRIGNGDIQSKKNRAENVMIVDLMRNDLSEYCEPGSVHASSLFQEERVGELVHLVSVVEGKLDDRYTAIELLLGCFPAGSISGAPKLRAIEIAAELEGKRRGFYCGSSFYTKPDGSLRSSVLIRSATLMEEKEGTFKVRYGAGGAIVSDSLPFSEVEETLDKLGPIEKLKKGGNSNEVY